VCALLVSHFTNCASLAYLAVLSVGGHIAGLAAVPYYLLHEVPAKSFWTLLGVLTFLKQLFPVICVQCGDIFPLVLP
jgi:hypothetical protein